MMWRKEEETSAVRTPWDCISRTSSCAPGMNRSSPAATAPSSSLPTSRSSTCSTVTSSRPIRSTMARPTVGREWPTCAAESSVLHSAPYSAMVASSERIQIGSVSTKVLSKSHSTASGRAAVAKGWLVRVMVPPFLQRGPTFDLRRKTRPFGHWVSQPGSDRMDGTVPRFHKDF